MKTYDVLFNDSENSNNKGFKISYDEARDYIRQNNGTNGSYFKDYKDGFVSVVDNETGETVYEEEIIDPDNVRFNSFYYGVAILFSNTPFNRDEVVKELLASEFGEWASGGYRFVLLD